MKKRYEAFEITDVDDMFSVMMNIMPHRYDATNYCMEEIDCEPMDNYIAKKREEGISYNYMHIVVASIIRTMAIKKGLNRFIMNARMYERYKITMCMTIKLSLKESAPELITKVDFNGNETLAQVCQKIKADIEKQLAEAENSATSEATKSISSLPMFISKALVNYLKFSDKRNFMPKVFHDVSPFHNSFFFTNLKSIKTDSIFHHCYDFGTTSFFFAMGKEKWMPVVDENKQIVARKILPLGISTDERICDGLYHGTAFKMLRHYILHPEELETEYHDEKVDAEIEKDRIAAEKLAAKNAKIEAKKQKKTKK